MKPTNNNIETELIKSPGVREIEFLHFHISVVGSYLRMCIVYKSIYSCPRRFFDVSGKKKVPPADADGTLVSGLGKINVSFAAACFIPNASLAFPC